jgi:hypothetical protein
MRSFKPHGFPFKFDNFEDRFTLRPTFNFARIPNATRYVFIFYFYLINSIFTIYSR